MTRKALGRGLSALLREVETASAGLEQVPVDLIDPNPFQPRSAFPEETLRELAESIRSSGVLQPILVRRVDGKYQLIAGERRLRAARMAGLQAVPAVIRDLGDRETLELAVTENVMREDLNPIEVAHAYDSLQERFQLSHEEIAARIGINRSTVSNTLRLLGLPEQIQNMVANGDVSAGHARALLGLQSADRQNELAQLIAKRGLSVRQVESIVASAQSAPEAQRVARKVDPNTRAAALEMERSLGTRVRIIGSENRGKIEISYFSGDDLQRLYELLTRRNTPT
ncbi:MAG TPA: ParB/RepB/Spo0J family partition protein [Terriglobia bacterium]|nr:ParB/RepB/Spo0J family partition protein [Terriglobia bacterium]